MYPGSPFVQGCLAGNTALITGGTSGIGLEIARCLGAHGCNIAVTGRRQGVLDEAVQAMKKEGIKATGCQGDVRKFEDCARWVTTCVETHGSLNIVVNCAAGNFLATAEELSSGGFRSVMEIDALGTFNMSRAAHSALSKAKNASIINISATLHYGASWWQVHASAAKAAVDSITRTLAMEWGSAGIRVNAVAPGPIKGTAGMSKLAPSQGRSIEDIVAATVPVGRMGERSDIALACVYLASSAGSYVSGHVLVVDGAAWMWKEQLVSRKQVSSVSRAVEGQSRQVGTASRSKL